MERITIQAEKREETGKGAARSMRRQDMIPAVLYREGNSLPIKLPKKDFIQFINKTMGQQVMVNLQFADGQNKLALMKEFQVDPTKRELLHADFFEISLTEEVKLSIHIVTTGDPVGVKRDGGIFQHVLREIEIECLPDKIPGNVQIDITPLEIGQSFHVKDLAIGEGIKVLSESDEVICTVVAPVVEEAPAEEEAAPESAEPELIKKGKKEEGEEGEEKKEEKEGS